jgi:hypothetical protein
MQPTQKAARLISGVMLENMKLIECPYCKKQAVGLFGLLIYFTPWTFFKDCKYCQNDLRLNYSFLFYAIALPILGLYLLGQWLGLYVIPVTIIYFLVLIAFLKKTDPKLFVKRDAWSNKKM